MRKKRGKDRLTFNKKIEWEKEEKEIKWHLIKEMSRKMKREIDWCLLKKIEWEKENEKLDWHLLKIFEWKKEKEETVMGN